MSNKKKAIIAGIVVLVLIVVIIANLQKGSGKTFKVQVSEAKRGRIVHMVSGTGRIQPKLAVNISANVSARIIRLHVDEGDTVRKGQVLVELDRTRYEAAVVQAKASLSSARANARMQKANLDKAKVDYERVQKLFDQGLASQGELDNVRAQYEVAKANYEAALDQVTRAEAILEQAKDDLEKTIIRSPIDGVVTRLNKEEGEIALGSQFQEDVIMVVSDLSNLEAVCEIDETDVVNVSVGDSSIIRIDAFPDTSFVGRVSEIAHTARTRGLGTQEEVTNFEVRISVLDEIKDVRPGMSATVDIITDVKDDALKVPIQAVTVREEKVIRKALAKRKKSKRAEETGDSAGAVQEEPAAGNGNELREVVFVVKDDKVELRPVKTGIIGETEIEILSGVEEGEKVVTGSYRVLSKDLYDGARVKVEKKRLKRTVTEK
jgi:HlyD family secretion protein